VPVPNLAQFFFLDYVLSGSTLRSFVRARHHYGANPSRGGSDPAFVPVAFDLRTKGSLSGRTVGLRRWLSWDETANRPRWPHELLCQVMGASQKGGGDLSDEDRSSSRVFVSMPYRDGHTYRLRWFGLVPPDRVLPDGQLLTVDVLADEIREYMRQLFDEAQPSCVTLGRELLEEARQ
jgi:hypothetical protein